MGPLFFYSLFKEKKPAYPDFSGHRFTNSDSSQPKNYAGSEGPLHYLRTSVWLSLATSFPALTRVLIFMTWCSFKLVFWGKKAGLSYRLLAYQRRAVIIPAQSGSYACLGLHGLTRLLVFIVLSLRSMNNRNSYLVVVNIFIDS